MWCRKFWGSAKSSIGHHAKNTVVCYKEEICAENCSTYCMCKVHGAQEANGCKCNLPEQRDDALTLNWVYFKDFGDDFFVIQHSD